MRRKYAEKPLGNILVLGLGVSGKALVSYLLPLLGSRVSSITVYAGDRDGGAQEWLRETPGVADGVNAVFSDEEIPGNFDLCIASPGISEFSELYLKAEGISSELIGEVEFAWRESPECAKWVAITGTNGKTTTTALTAALLRAAGFDAYSLGNIGDASITVMSEASADAKDDTVFVLEASSYQLASTVDFSPDAAVILGITPDHLAWHRTHENYAAAKFKLLDNLHEGAVAVLDAVNDEVRAKVRELRSNLDRRFAYIPIGTSKGIGGDMRDACGSENAAFVDGCGCLEVAFEDACHTLACRQDMQLKGDHNCINALAASAVAVAFGASDASIKAALESFAPLEHRIEPCGTVRGVSFYNDSKATNVDATLVAIGAFAPKRPVVMLGGRDKGTDLEPLVQACGQFASDVVCFGEAKDRFAQAFAPSSHSGLGCALHTADTFDDAFHVAVQIAGEGDGVVLLSPACASFDEFSCFEERGRHFKKLVEGFADSAPSA